MEGPPSKPAADAEVITEAEVGRFRREPAAALIEKFSPEVQEHVPPPDAEIITLADATRNLAAGSRAREIKPRPGRYEEQRFGGRPPHTPAAGLPVISYSDPSVLCVEERAAQRRLERENQNFNAPAAKPAVQEAVRPSEKGFNAPETIEESDIRANLMMRRMARQRQSARRSDIAPRIIPADEVISNLARTERPSRRLRRISTVDNASILPASARIPITAEKWSSRNPPPSRFVQTVPWPTVSPLIPTVDRPKCRRPMPRWLNRRPCRRHRL